MINSSLDSKSLLKKNLKKLEKNKEYIKFDSVEGAYNKIGGFGRLQFLSMVLLGFTRNYGMHQIYGFAISTFETPAFLCKSSPDEIYTSCNRDFICE